MGMSSRFMQPAYNRRPFGSHRFDVYSPKISRQLTLFGMAAVDLWTSLEADPDILTFCERPLLIPDTRPRRAADFWVQSRQGEQLLVLQRTGPIPEGTPEAPDAIVPEPSLIDGIAVRYVPADDFDRIRTKLTNWGWIIRDLAAFSRFVPESLCREVAMSIGSGKSIAQLQADLADFDGSTVRLAVYLLLHRGQAVCRQLATQALEPTHIVELA